MPVHEDKPDETTDAYDAMMEYWELPLTLRGGTPSMIDAGRTYLPQEKEEADSDYNIRLKLGTLFGGYDDTIMKLASRPFVKPIVIENLSDELKYLESDTDGDRTTLTDLGTSLAEGMIDLGLVHLLVDFSTIEENQKGTVTKQQEKNVGARVFFVQYGAEDVIWWDVDEHGELNEARFKETKLKEGSSVKLIRVYTKESWEIWEFKKDKGKEKWLQIESGSHTFGRIPLVTIYAKKTGRMTGRPPLYNLADQNLAHWKITADYKAALRFALFGIIFVKGVSPETKIGIGPGSVFKVKDTEADMKHVEHNGHSITAGREEIIATEGRMETMGLQPLIRSGGPDTATGKSIDESRSRSPLQKWARNIEEGLEDAFLLAAEWHKISDMPDDFQITIFKDFALNLSGVTNMKLLLESTKANKLSNETYLLELKRYGALNDALDINEEMARITDEFTVMTNLINDSDEGEENNGSEDSE